MDDIVDLLKIKIEKARRELPLDTVNAIDSVDWRNSILELREKKGYTFEQLGDLELETELLLCGLVSPENYPKELEKSMKISKPAVNELVAEMNIQVFGKIREELVKITERKKVFQKNKVTNREETGATKVLNSTGIEIIPEKLELTTKPTLANGGLEIKEEASVEKREDILKIIEKPEPARNAFSIADAGGETHPILAQKLSAPVQIPTVKTDHSVENISKPTTTSYPKNADPYRLPPE